METIPYLQVELAVLWADRTWSDGHFEYEPVGFPLLTIKANAIAKLEEKLSSGPAVSMVAVYSVDGSGQRYDAKGNLLEASE